MEGTLSKSYLRSDDYKQVSEIILKRQVDSNMRISVSLILVFIMVYPHIEPDRCKKTR